MTGWKGVTGGIGLMVSAIALGAIKMISPDLPYGIGLGEAMAMFFAGLGLLGVRLAMPTAK